MVGKRRWAGEVSDEAVHVERAWARCWGLEQAEVASFGWA